MSAEAALTGLRGLSFESPTGPVAIDAENQHATMPIVVAPRQQGRATGCQKTRPYWPGPWLQHLNAEKRMSDLEPLFPKRFFRWCGWLIMLGLLGACAPRPQGDLAALRRAEIPSGITDARGRAVSSRALKAYKTSQVRTVEKQYATADHTLSQLPGVVAVRPGSGVVYVYTTRPAELPAEF